MSLRPMLSLVDEMAATVEAFELSVVCGRPQDSFDGQVLLRGLSALRAVRLLVAASLWEIAAAPARQLFELVINMEYLGSQSDRRVAVSEYLAYGVLQLNLASAERYDYELKTGREMDKARLSVIVQNLDDPAFEKFEVKPAKDGTTRWAKSWNSKNAWELSQLSQSPMRIAQYRQLFSSWSEQAHGTPGALVAQIGRKEQVHHTGLLLGDTIARSLEVLGTSMQLFVELWISLNSVPRPDGQVFIDWAGRLQTFSMPYRQNEFSPNSPPQGAAPTPS